VTDILRDYEWWRSLPVHPADLLYEDDYKLMEDLWH